MPKRGRDDGGGKQRASPEASSGAPLSDYEVRVILAADAEAVLDKVRDVAEQIDERVRRVIGEPERKRRRSGGARP
jgi:hypothetical protein